MSTDGIDTKIGQSLDGLSFNLCSMFCLFLSFGQEHFWVKIFEMDGWPQPSTGGPCLSTGGSLYRLYLPSLGILVKVIDTGSWEPLTPLESETF